MRGNGNRDGAPEKVRRKAPKKSAQRPFESLRKAPEKVRSKAPEKSGQTASKFLQKAPEIVRRFPKTLRSPSVLRNPIGKMGKMVRWVRW